MNEEKIKAIDEFSQNDNNILFLQVNVLTQFKYLFTFLLIFTANVPANVPNIRKRSRLLLTS